MSTKLTCSTQLILNDKNVSAKDVFDLILDKNTPKHEINYGSSVQHAVEYENNELKKIKLKTTDKIHQNITSGGIYFILSSDEKNILYVGKDKNLKYRLKQHLIECSKSTSSHIKDVLDYLLDRQKKGFSLCIRYCVINTVDNKNNAAIEERLIDYIFESSDHVFDECWNKRKD